MVMRKLVMARKMAFWNSVMRNGFRKVQMFCCAVWYMRDTADVGCYMLFRVNVNIDVEVGINTIRLPFQS